MKNIFYFRINTGFGLDFYFFVIAELSKIKRRPLIAYSITTEPCLLF